MEALIYLHNFQCHCLKLYIYNGVIILRYGSEITFVLGRSLFILQRSEAVELSQIVFAFGDIRPTFRLALWRYVKPSMCSLPLSPCLPLSPPDRLPAVGKPSNPRRPQFRLSWRPAGDKPYRRRNLILMSRVICTKWGLI